MNKIYQSMRTNFIFDDNIDDNVQDEDFIFEMILMLMFMMIS